jgi:hypothetical protein
MIPIKILDKQYKIKTIDELTTSEYIFLSGIENLDIVKYIAWQCSLDMDTAFFAVVSKAVEKGVGKMQEIDKMPRPKLDYVDYSKTIQTVGQRHQIEACNLVHLKLLVFSLAVAQARSNNIDDVQKLYDEYLKRPWFEILPAGFFFIRTLRNGRSKEVSFFGKLAVLTKMQNLRRRLVFKS